MKNVIISKTGGKADTRQTNLRPLFEQHLLIAVSDALINKWEMVWPLTNAFNVSSYETKLDVYSKE